MTAQANVPIEFLQFSGGERHIQLQPELLNQLQAHAQITASLNHSTDVMDYLLLENVLLEQQENDISNSPKAISTDFDFKYSPYFCPTKMGIKIQKKGIKYIPTA